jgi:hypothetical protein
MQDETRGGAVTVARRDNPHHWGAAASSANVTTVLVERVAQAAKSS